MGGGIPLAYNQEIHRKKHGQKYDNRDDGYKDFLQVVVPVAKVSLEPPRMDGCGNDIGVVAVNFGAEELSTFANLLEAIGLTSFDFLLGTSKVPTGYPNHVCAVLVTIELRHGFHSADKRCPWIRGKVRGRK